MYISVYACTYPQNHYVIAYTPPLYIYIYIYICIHTCAISA